MSEEKNNGGSGEDERLALIRKKIQSGLITAISVDTNVFDRNGKRLDTGVFSQLTQFGEHPNRLVIADVVFREIKRHLLGHLKEAHDRVKKDSGDVWKFVGGSSDDWNKWREKVDALPTIEESCERQIDAFIDASSAEIIGADQYLKVGDILNLYFDRKPPFHQDNPKKSEFPDAVALTCLERWAADGNGEIVVVSRDGDWKSFCQKSELLHLVEDLSTALSLFQTVDEIVQEMIKKIEKQFDLDESPLLSLVEEHLSEFDWGRWVYLEAYSSFDFEDGEIEITEVRKISLVDGRNRIKLINKKDGTIAVTLSIKVDASFNGHFVFHTRDSIDKDLLSLGSGVKGFNEAFEMRLGVTIPITNGELEFSWGDIWIDMDRKTFSIGDIEPSWMNDPAEYE